MQGSTKSFLGFVAAIAVIIGTAHQAMTRLNTLLKEGGSLVSLLLNVAYHIGKLEFFMLTGALLALGLLLVLKGIGLLFQSRSSMGVKGDRTSSTTLLFLGIGAMVGLYSFFYPQTFSIHALIGWNAGKMRGFETFYPLLGFITLFVGTYTAYRLSWGKH
ncbi:MAG: hypothetical protein MUF49_12210 [Oculatellaceae cyanobacterium Prado106]|nr:hypothetical protein [Oculatellaceae cyanobacterium Prado106]